jgi:hypothetical protein
MVAVVCFNEINAPGSQRASVVVKVTVAAGSTELASQGANARVKPDF